jgi:hypothetical protein
VRRRVDALNRPISHRFETRSHGLGINIIHWREPGVSAGPHILITRLDRVPACCSHPPNLLCKVIHVHPSLTGSGESGKSTIVKQMEIIHQTRFSREELLTYRMTNLVDSAQAIVLAMRKIEIDCETPSNRVSILRFCRFRCTSVWLLCIFTFLRSCSFRLSYPSVFVSSRSVPSLSRSISGMPCISTHHRYLLSCIGSWILSCPDSPSLRQIVTA